MAKSVEELEQELADAKEQKEIAFKEKTLLLGMYWTRGVSLRKS